MTNSNLLKYINSHYSVQIVNVLIDTPEFTGTGRKLSETESGKNIFVLVYEVTCKQSNKKISHIGKDKVGAFPCQMISYPKFLKSETSLVIEDDEVMKELFESEDKRDEAIPTILPKDWQTI